MTVNAALIAVIAASLCAAALTASRGHRRAATREVLTGGLALALLSLLAIAACAAVVLVAAVAATAG